MSSLEPDQEVVEDVTFQGAIEVQQPFKSGMEFSPEEDTWDDTITPTVSRNGSIFVPPRRQKLILTSSDHLEDLPMFSGQILTRGSSASPECSTPTPEEFGRMFSIPEPKPRPRPCSVRDRSRRSVRALFDRAMTFSASGSFSNLALKSPTLEKSKTIDMSSRIMSFDTQPVQDLLRVPNSPDLSSRSKVDDKIIPRPKSPLVGSVAESSGASRKVRKAASDISSKSKTDFNISKVSSEAKDLNFSKVPAVPIKLLQQRSIEDARNKTSNRRDEDDCFSVQAPGMRMRSSSMIVGKSLLAKRKL